MVRTSGSEAPSGLYIAADLGYADLQLLGMGRNGHIGFNEPCDHFSKQTRLVNLTKSTIEANARFFSHAEDVPRQALTMGIGTIMKARKILAEVSGENKADAALVGGEAALSKL